MLIIIAIIILVSICLVVYSTNVQYKDEGLYYDDKLVEIRKSLTGRALYSELLFNALLSDDVGFKIRVYRSIMIFRKVSSTQYFYEINLGAPTPIFSISMNGDLTCPIADKYGIKHVFDIDKGMIFKTPEDEALFELVK